MVVTSADRIAEVRRAADAIASWTGGVTPRALVILGSGLGSVAEAMQAKSERTFSELPGFAEASVPGHDGRFALGSIGGVPVLAMRGRLHLYEGHSADRVVLPVRAAALLGCRTLIATNAAGAVREDLPAGRPMLITDHIAFLVENVLAGPNLDELGPRFPNMSEAYSARLQALARAVAAEQGVVLAEGVYAAVPGPSFETPAEVRALRALGADAVGMSTVSEVIAARHAGMDVLAFSFITNAAAAPEHEHGGVLSASAEGAAVLAGLVTAIIGRL
jgi:purine-nucleoside phosphorylase